MTKISSERIVKMDGDGVSGVSEARSKILDGSYPSNVIGGRQRKHIEGTREFEQKRTQMQKESPGSEPSILSVDAQSLVDKYKGMGYVNLPKNSKYPVEIVDTDGIVGKTWVKSMSKYVETNRIRIVYSSKGVHIIPINTFERK